MKKLPLFIFAAFLFILQPAFADFTDVTDQTLYKEAIQWTVEEGVTQGYGDGNWGPDDCVTRSQLLKMVLEYRFREDLDNLFYDLEIKDTFPDVLEENWDFNYVAYARFMEIVDGYPDGTFLPNACVNRVEAMKIAVKTLLPGEEVMNPEFLSYNSRAILDMDVAAWYAPYAKRLFQDVLVGTEHTQPLYEDDFGGPCCKTPFPIPIYFFPAESMSRKEVAEMLYRIDQFKSPYPNVTYQIESGEPEGAEIFKQSLVRIDESGQKEVIVENAIQEYGLVFAIIRNPTGDSNDLILKTLDKTTEEYTPSLYSFNPNTSELKEFNIGKDLKSGYYHQFSPDGKNMLWVSVNSNDADQTMYLVDLVNDTYQSLVILPEDEAFQSGGKASPFGFHVEWIDNQTLKYAVYQPYLEGYENVFLEYRKVSISDPLKSNYYSEKSQKALPYFYIEPTDQPEGIFIYMHGAGGGYEQGMSDESYAGNFGNLKQVLKDMNFVYATPETSDFGESGGLDLVDFMGHLKEKYGDLPMYLSGASAGGQTIFHALNQADSELPIKGAAFVVPALSKTMLDTFNPQVEKFKVWVEGGELDGVFPPDRLNYFENVLFKKSYPMKTHMIPGGDHNAPVEQIDWEGVLDYLLYSLSISGEVPIENDPFDFGGTSQEDSLLTEGDLLKIKVNYSGGCQPHLFDLWWKDNFLETDGQMGVTLDLVHNAQGDSCQAYLEETLEFDIQSIKKAYQSEFGYVPGVIKIDVKGADDQQESIDYEF